MNIPIKNDKLPPPWFFTRATAVMDQTRWRNGLWPIPVFIRLTTSEHHSHNGKQGRGVGLRIISDLRERNWGRNADVSLFIPSPVLFLFAPLNYEFVTMPFCSICDSCESCHRVFYLNQFFFFQKLIRGFGLKLLLMLSVLDISPLARIKCSQFYKFVISLFQTS